MYIFKCEHVYTVYRYGFEDAQISVVIVDLMYLKCTETTSARVTELAT